MKYRYGFVSNSSTGSYVVAGCLIALSNDVDERYGYLEYLDELFEETDYSYYSGSDFGLSETEAIVGKRISRYTDSSPQDYIQSVNVTELEHIEKILHHHGINGEFAVYAFSGIM